VPQYVLKSFNPSGRLIGRVEFRCAADDEAMTALLCMNEQKSCELWCGPRLVTRWPGQTAGSISRTRPKRARPPSRAGAAGLLLYVSPAGE
jgi:hypothetical protein